MATPPKAKTTNAKDEFHRLIMGSLGLESGDRAEAVEKYGHAPVAWVKDRLGEFVWSKQREVLEALADPAIRRIAVHSAHGVGKTFLAARAVAWWIESHPLGSAFALTTATTNAQVKGALWKELRRAHAVGQLTGRMNQMEWLVTMPTGQEETVAIGIKPSDDDPTAYQGRHTKYMLVVVDEAGGVPRQLWPAFDSLTSNDDSKILVIGNPDDPASEFAEVCKPGSGWKVIHISAFDSPNFTGEEVPDKIRAETVGKRWVEEKRKQLGETSPIYISKVLGLFPEINSDGLIPISWIRQAQERNLKMTPGTWEEHAPIGIPVELGVDVGAGGDRNVVCARWGGYARIIRRDYQPNTMRTLGNVMHDIKRTNAEIAKVDSIGIGTGAVDRATEIASEKYKDGKRGGQRTDQSFVAERIKGIKVSTRAFQDDEFVNLRAEIYWNLRLQFQEGTIDIDPDDDDLASQLSELRYYRTSKGLIKIESKDEMKARGKHSPDDADALALAFGDRRGGHKKTKATWGRPRGLYDKYKKTIKREAVRKPPSMRA